MAMEFQLFDNEELEQLELLARRRGYDETKAYLLSLVAADAAEHDEPIPFEDVDIRAELKEGLRQAFRGETVSLESLWTDDDE